MIDVAHADYVVEIQLGLKINVACVNSRYEN